MPNLINQKQRAISEFFTSDFQLSHGSLGTCVQYSSNTFSSNGFWSKASRPILLGQVRLSQDWTKSFGQKPIGGKGVGRKVGLPIGDDPRLRYAGSVHPLSQSDQCSKLSKKCFTKKYLQEKKIWACENIRFFSRHFFF